MGLSRRLELTRVIENVKKHENSKIFFGIILSIVFLLQVVNFTKTALILQNYLPASDYFSLLERYISYTQNEISLASLIFSKQADHNHVFTFLIGYLDLRYFSGSMILFNIGILISVAVVLIFAIHTAFKLDENVIHLRSFFFTIFVIAQLFTPYGFELWQFPFQFVQVSTRMFVLLGTFLYIKGLMEFKKSAYRTGYIFLTIATVSHGSGNLVPFFQLAFVTVIYYKLRPQRFLMKLVPIFVNFLIILILNIGFPPQTQPFKMFSSIQLSQWLSLPIITLRLLGQSVFWDLNSSIAVAVGILAVCILFASLFAMYRSSQIDLISLTFAGSGLFFLVCLANSVIVNFYYQQSRGVLSPTDSYFWASRYQSITSGFWISAAFLLYRKICSDLTLLESVVPKILTVVVILSVYTSQNHALLQNVRSQNRTNTIAARFIAETPNLADVPNEFLTTTFFLPVAWGDQLRKDLEFMKRQSLGFWSLPLEIDPSANILDLTDENWLNGKSRSDLVFLYLNTKSNLKVLQKGLMFQFQGINYVIETTSQFGIYLHVRANLSVK
jgi:hypothetical protein